MHVERKVPQINIGNISLALLFFYLFIFCLPFFKRIEIFSPFSFFESRFIDYLTFSIYGFEILFILALIFFLFEVLIGRKKIKTGDLKIFFSWIAVIFFSFLSLFFAYSITIGLYYILILFWIFLVYIFIINKIKNFADGFILLNVFVFSIFLQSILAIIQFIRNGSVGFYILGEQILSSNMDGVAKTIINGVKHIRPYGTFSHPNVLALFLLVAGSVVLYLFFEFNSKKYKIYLSFVFAFLSVALLLTFSRIAWVAGLVFWGGYMILKLNLKFKNSKPQFKIQNLLKYILTLLIPIIIFTLYLDLAPSIWIRINPFLGLTWESFDVRLIVITKSWFLIRNNLLGIGIGNFVIEIAYQLTGYPVWMIEPAHNIFILILTETGILGFFSFISFLYFIAKKLKNITLFLRCIFILFIFMMFFDHYFWDLRQAQVLLMLFLGLIISDNINNVFSKGENNAR